MFLPYHYFLSTKASFFGSIVRGEMTEESDVDFLV